MFKPTKMTWEQSQSGAAENGKPVGLGFYHMPDGKKVPFLEGLPVWKTDVQDAADALGVPLEE
jgi:hypothetical protein